MAVIRAGVIMTAIIVAAGFPEPAEARSCWCECFNTPHGRVCRWRCVQPARPQVYVPPPRYTPPPSRYVPPTTQYYERETRYEHASASSGDGGAALAVLLFFGLMILAFCSSSSETEQAREVADIDAETPVLAAVRAKVEEAAREADAAIAQERERAYRRGREAP